MGPRGRLAEARKHLHRILEQLDAARGQLLGVKLSLTEPAAERDRFADVSDEPDAVTRLRTTIECVLEDDLRPALQDLQDALASTAEAAEEEEP